MCPQVVHTVRLSYEEESILLFNLESSSAEASTHIEYVDVSMRYSLLSTSWRFVVVISVMFMQIFKLNKASLISIMIPLGLAQVTGDL